MNQQIRHLQEHHARRVQDCAAEILDYRPIVVSASVGRSRGDLVNRELVCAMDLREWSPSDAWAAVNWVVARMRHVAAIIPHDKAPTIGRVNPNVAFVQHGDVLIPGTHARSDEVGVFHEFWWPH